MGIFPAAEACIFMADNVSGALVPYQTYPSELIKKNFTLNEEILKEVTQKQMAIMTQDAVSDEQPEPSTTTPKKRSLMIAPLAVEASLVGALQLSSETDGTFNGDDMDLFVAIGNQLAVGINSKILE